MNTLFEYIKDNGDLENFVVGMYRWFEGSGNEAIHYLREQLPKSIIGEYLVNTTMYRGMVTNLDYIMGEDHTSWTTDLEVAIGFAQIESNLDPIIDQFDEIHEIVLEKRGEGLDLTKLGGHLVDLIQKGFRVSEYESEDLIRSFTLKEGEIISDLEVDGVNIKEKYLIHLTGKLLQNKIEEEVEDGLSFIEIMEKYKYAVDIGELGKILMKCDFKV